MFKTSFKMVQVSILSIALLNLNLAAFAQDFQGVQTNAGEAGLSELQQEKSNLNQGLKAQTSEAMKRMEDARAAINQARASAGLSPLYSGEGDKPGQDEIQAEKKIWDDLKTKADNGDQAAKNQLADLKNTSDKFENAIAVVTALQQRSEAAASSPATSPASYPLPFNATSTATQSAGGADQSVQLAGVNDSSDMMGSITMIAVGFIASRLYKYKMTTDIMIAAAGGAAFIVGEIMSTNKFKDVSEDLEVQIKRDHDDQTQIESLNKLKMSYEEAKSAAETKKKFQLAAAVAFIAAAAAAFFMKGLEIAAEVKTVAALTLASGKATTTANAAKITCSKSGVGCELIGPCTLAATTFSADVAARKAMNFSRDMTAAPSLTCKASDYALREPFLAQAMSVSSGCPVTLPAIGAIKAEDTILIINDTAGPAVTTIVDTHLLKPLNFYSQTPIPSINQNYFDKLLNFFMPSAQASMMNLLMGGAGVGVGILVGMIGTMGTSIDTFMFAPKNRGIIWGVLAGLSFGASKSTERVIAKLTDNIQKIDWMLANMNSMADGTGVGDGTGGGGTGGGSGPVINDPITGKPGNKDILQKPSTPNGTTGQGTFISANPANRTSCLGSAGDSNCKSLSDQMVNLPDFQMLPSSLQGISRDVAKMGDGLSGTNGISGSTSGVASSLGAKMNAINKQLDKNKANLNKLLAKAKKPGIDFSKEQNKLQNGLTNAAAKALQKGGMSPAGFLSSIGSGSGSGSGSGMDTSSANKPLDQDNLKNNAPTKTGSMYPPVNGNGYSNLNGDKGFGDDMMASSEGALAGGEGKENPDAYEISGNDISSDSSASIFELISARYLKSGYRRLFREITEKK